MAGGQQQLRSVIVLSGNVDGSFSALSKHLDSLGTTLTNIGARIDPVSQKLIGQGKASIDTYAGFEDVMLQIKSISGMTDAELDKVEQAARDAGRTTRYTAVDAATAELVLAQAGLGTKDIIDTLPDVLELAQAGGIGLEESANYLRSSLAAMGYDLSYAETLVDQMAKTAAVGSTDIDTLGQSLMRLGSGAQLIQGGSSEILAILSEISVFGEDMQGSEAGTAVRNFFMSLIAPSGAKEEIVEMLENIGSSAEELDEIMEGVTLEGAARAIERMELSVFDSEGNLNDGIEIIQSLRDSMRGMTDEQMDPILGQIFGKRTFTIAKNLMSISDEAWASTKAKIEDSKGFAAQMAETQESGLAGALRLLDSQIEAFQLSLGDTLDPYVREVAGAVGDMAVAFSQLDDTTRENVVAIMGAIALAGPAALAVGAGLQLMAFALSPAGIAAGSIVALTALAKVLDNIEQARLADAFGDMELNEETLSAYVSGLNTEFTEAAKQVGAYGKAADEALGEYQQSSSELSGGLMSALITNMQIIDSDRTHLQSLGAQMYTEAMSGLTNAQAESEGILKALFEGSNAPGDQLILGDILSVEDAYFGDLSDKMTGIGERLRAALTEAFVDDRLDSMERERIMALIGDMNAAVAEAVEAQNRIELEKLLYKGQTASLESLNAFDQMIDEQQTKALADSDDRYAEARARAKIAYDKQIGEASTLPEKRGLTLRRDAALSTMEAQYRRERMGIEAEYAMPKALARQAGLKDSVYGDMYREVLSLADQFTQNGGGTLDVSDWLTKLGDQDFSNRFQDFFVEIEKINDALGGTDRLNELYGHFRSTGEPIPEALGAFAELNKVANMASSLGATISQGFQTNIEPMMGQEILAADEAIRALQAQDFSGVGAEQAANYIGPMGDTLAGGGAALYDATYQSVSQIPEAGAAALQEHSPSRIAIEQGMNYVLGLAMGIMQGIGLVASAGTSAGEAAIGGVDGALGDGTEAGGNWLAVFGQNLLGAFGGVVEASGVGEAIDGVLEAAIQDGTRAFGQMYQDGVDGIGEGVKHSLLESEPMVLDQVGHLQMALDQSGFHLPRFGVDNIIGPETSAALQQAMTEVGYNLPKFGIDGIIGKETAGTLQQMLTDYGFELPEFGIDGILGEETMAALEAYVKWLEENDLEFGVKPVIKGEPVTQTDPDGTSTDAATETRKIPIEYTTDGAPPLPEPEPQQVTRTVELSDAEPPTMPEATTQTATMAMDVSGAQSDIDALGNQVIIVQVDANIDSAQSAITALDGQTVTASIGGDNASAQSAIDALGSQTVSVQVDASTGSAQSAISALDGQTVTASVGGNTASAQSAITALGGQSVSVKLTGDDSGIRSLLSSGYSATVRLSYDTSGKPDAFATGGRADEPSIFGDAGPEWAIPEAHTSRTAELLVSAARASGFTWSELLGARGGLNARAERPSVSVVYQPTIYAQDAEDVEQKLAEDKQRFEAWFEDWMDRRQMHEERVSYG